MRFIFAVLVIVSLMLTSGCASKVAVPAAGMAIITPAVVLKVVGDISDSKKYQKGYSDGSQIAFGHTPGQMFVVVYKTTEKGRYKDGLYHGWFDTMFLIAIKQHEVVRPK